MKRFVALVLLLVGCPTEPMDVCENLSPGTARSAEIGSYDGDGNFVAYMDGGETPLIFGFQGGYMVTPVIRVPALAGDTPTPCFNIRIDNELDPAGSAPDLDFSMIGEAEDGMYTLEGISNFLGNVRRDLVGRTLTMDVDIVADGFTVEETIQVVLIPDL